jgi:hypothetical protein
MLNPQSALGLSQKLGSHDEDGKRRRQVHSNRPSPLSFAWERVPVPIIPTYHASSMDGAGIDFGKREKRGQVRMAGS